MGVTFLSHLSSSSLGVLAHKARKYPMLDFLAEISTVDPRFNLPNDDPMKCVIEGPKHNTDPGEWKGAVFDHYKNVLKKNYRLLSPPFETYTRLGDNQTSSQVPVKYTSYFARRLHIHRILHHTHG